jgi:hypothetical protein
MMTLHQTATTDELERILATFHAASDMCKTALFTTLYALSTFLLDFMHIFTFVINFTIGVLMCLHALGCMARLLLVLCQELTKTPLITIGGRN